MPRYLYLALALVACGDAGTPEPGSDSLTAPADAPAPPVAVVGGSEQSSWEEPSEVLITNASSWEAAWTHLHDGVSPPPALPVVDFTSQRVLVVTAGMRPSGGFALELTDHEIMADTVAVDVSISIPGLGCNVTMAMTAPAITLAIPLTPEAVVVRRSERVVDCDP